MQAQFRSVWLPGIQTMSRIRLGKAIAGIALMGSVSIACAAHADEPGKFLGDAIQDGRAEIQSCQLALRTSSDPSVQAFAKRMIADHESLDARIETLAQRKGYTLPDGISMTQQATQTVLKPLTGHAFDLAFMKHNVSDHEADIKQFSEEAQKGSDADVRSLAAGALPTLQEHLKLAEQTQAKVKR
ncbi:DUF4142 domain-containing protein [Paraburkholderia sp. MMS20-SJTN17]|uniref:DUF4142 domain-containing protein n=1 Tax=Paraburkholderia translucens TaxID=2886945 RepID=A0ABS8KH21_9BURK|nr:DUF4142 domain-containing protein [Paraburkholderia sp. MMS20-SJTN17]MCC8404038.1 DUF4142 domain-containing protein [Paraburkholderia sp. MMS20-SJTN17]